MEEIIYPASKQKFKVLVRCFTYNQSQYIEDALNGFAMQQTKFPFVCLVMDDYSTDGEQEVIKAYLDRECDMTRAEFFEDDTTTMTLVPHRTNVNCIFAAYLLKKNLYKVKGAKMAYVTPWREHCEYEALCEGDDYWTDPYKLQKQVDFLEKNTDYVLCCTSYSRREQSELYEIKYDHIHEISLEALLSENMIATVTTCYKREAAKGYSCPLDHLRMGDYPLWLYLIGKGRVGYLPFDSSVYRVLENSASCRNNIDQYYLFFYDSILVKEYYALLYHQNDLIPQLVSTPFKEIMDACYLRKSLVIPDGIARKVRKYCALSISDYVRLWSLGSKWKYHVSEKIIALLKKFKY